MLSNQLPSSTRSSLKNIVLLKIVFFSRFCDVFFSCFQRLIQHATGAARRQDLCVQSPQMYRAETFPVLISQIYSFVCSFHAFSQFISRITIKCVRLVATTRTIVASCSCTFLKQLMHPAGRGVVVVDPTRCYALVGYW